MIHLRLVNDNLHEARADFEKLKSHIDSIVDDSQYYVDLFIDLKNKNKITGSERDVYFWIKKHPQDLIDFINEKLATTSKSETKKKLKLAGSRVVCENDDWVVYAITSHDACRYYGRNTKWCITESSDYYWRKYLHQGYKFYFCINKYPADSAFDKLALQCKSKTIYQIWDSLDKNYKPSDLRFLNIPDITSDLLIHSKSRKIGDGLIQTSQDILNVKKANLSSSVIIPNSIIGIPNEEFADSRINKIVFEDNSSLKRLSNGLFYNCDQLTDIKLPDNLQIISRGAFHSCSNLDTVYLPDSVKILEPFCFADCENLTELAIPKSAELIDEGAFKSCTKLSNIDILSNDIEIHDSAFSNCDKLVIHASEKSNAHRFAIKHNIPFIATII